VTPAPGTKRSPVILFLAGRVERKRVAQFGIGVLAVDHGERIKRNGENQNDYRDAYWNTRDIVLNFCRISRNRVDIIAGARSDSARRDEHN
jgi:hypothetical protein